MRRACGRAIERSGAKARRRWRSACSLLRQPGARAARRGAGARRAAGRLPVALDRRSCREIGEYERTSTTRHQRLRRPGRRSLSGALGGRLAAEGVGAPAAGDAVERRCHAGRSAAEQRRRCIDRVRAGGRRDRRARRWRRRVGCRNLITLDMGGTTAKAALIEDGEIGPSTEYEIGAGDHALQPADEGWRLRAAVAGASTWPRSARVAASSGSMRRRAAGRAAQRRGRRPARPATGAAATEPTITDANVVLGYIGPERFAGGALRLNPTLAGAGAGAGRPANGDGAAAGCPRRSTSSGTRAWPARSGPSRPSAGTTCATSRCWRSAAAGRSTPRNGAVPGHPAGRRAAGIPACFGAGSAPRRPAMSSSIRSSRMLDQPRRGDARPRVRRTGRPVSGELAARAIRRRGACHRRGRSALRRPGVRVDRAGARWRGWGRPT